MTLPSDALQLVMRATGLAADQVPAAGDELLAVVQAAAILESRAARDLPEPARPLSAGDAAILDRLAPALYGAFYGRPWKVAQVLAGARTFDPAWSPIKLALEDLGDVRSEGFNVSFGRFLRRVNGHRVGHHAIVEAGEDRHQKTWHVVIR